MGKTTATRLKGVYVLLLPILLMIGVALAGGCTDTEIETPTQITENITPQEALALIQDNRDNPDFMVIDVRTPEEFAEEHIENATNLDYYAATFRNELDKLNKNKTYLIYCRSGTRSGSALDIMTELNFKEVYNIAGGINEWKAQGLPTEGHPAT